MFSCRFCGLQFRGIVCVVNDLVFCSHNTQLPCVGWGLVLECLDLQQEFCLTKTEMMSTFVHNIEKNQ